jgi:hypothetical protein
MGKRQQARTIEVNLGKLELHKLSVLRLIRMCFWSPAWKVLPLWGRRAKRQRVLQEAETAT